MERLKREDIERIVDSPALSIEEIAAVIKEELDIDIDITLEREQIIDIVFKSYNTALVEVEEQTQKTKTVEPKKKSSTSPSFTRKQCVLDAIEVGTYTKKEIIEEVNERFGYNLTGKTSRMRVGKVIKRLRTDGLVEELADGILRLKSQGK